MEKIDEGLIKWGALGLGIIALECIGTETLTHHAHRALEHPIGRIAVPVAVGLTGLHLLNKCPPQIDPYRGIGKIVDVIKH